MREHWKDIEGYEGIYQVSDLGRCKSLPKSFHCGKNNSTLKVYPEIMIKFGVSRKGYCSFGLSKNGVGITKYVHRAVAEAFIPNPLNLPEVNHENGLKWDNRKINLKWTDHDGNQKHASTNQLLALGERHPNSIFTEDQVKAIRKLYPSLSQQKIADKYGCDRGAIQKIVTRKTWKHIK